MNAKDRAEKIVRAISLDWQQCHPRTVDRAKELVATQLEEAEREAVKQARNEDWKEWLAAYRSMNPSVTELESAMWKFGKEIGKRVSDAGWMNILPPQFELCRKEAYAEGFRAARQKAKGIVEERMEQNAIATNLYALPENKLAKAVEAWMFGVAQRIGNMTVSDEPKGSIGEMEL